MSDSTTKKRSIWLSANQAGMELGVSGKTVIRMMENGDFPGYHIGSTWKFKRSDIEVYIESRRFQGRANKARESEVPKEVEPAA